MVPLEAEPTPMRERTRHIQTLSPKERERFARIGGITAHELGLAHEWNADTARAASLKGVEVRRQRAAARLGRHEDRTD